MKRKDYGHRFPMRPIVKPISTFDFVDPHGGLRRAVGGVARGPRLTCNGPDRVELFVPAGPSPVDVGKAVVESLRRYEAIKAEIEDRRRKADEDDQ